MTERPQHRVPALTGLRAVAALMVVGTHAFFWTGNHTDDAFGYFGARLESGVAVFFALSGYLLFRRWVHSQRSGAPLPTTWEYFRRRARRILPAYWIVVTIVYLVYLVRDGGPFGYRPFHGSIFTLSEVTVLVTVPLAWVLARLTQPRRLRRRQPRPSPDAERPQPRRRPVAENSSSSASDSGRSMPSPATQSSLK